ncbi:N-alpha-acetyltransferase 25, NatB auxiliary subunit [Favolaschia claudopus]|uniref:N-alpha-acetyltransferase 25, NatB auxiliary subunit n=1 Tax=Favolaschia claudopus TaxID=2862362 RepID=A0AAW0B3G3_9AGAR
MERQIKPIYEALDTGSNKSAIVACNKLLKKHPQNELVKTLKALALVRSQKVEESLVLCDEVLATKPTNDAVLTAMMHVLRGLGRHKDMVSMFEEAHKQQPNNEELAAQTFFANVRILNWKAAQQIATRMHKQFHEDRYIYWSVLSAILQANEPTTEPNMRALLYKLAHRLVTSSPTPSYVSADRFHLHLSILRELELYDEARTLLESDIGKSICAASLSCNEIRRDLWRRQGLLEDEGTKAEQRITEQADRNWLEFLSVLDATFSSLTTSSGTDDESAKAKCSSHLAKTQELFAKIAAQDRRKDRSGLLALLELEKRARTHGVSNDAGRLVDLMKRYFDEVGDKACCYEDLKPYLALEGDDATRWTHFLESLSPSFTSNNDLRRLINSHQLLRQNLSADDLNVAAETERAALYTQQYLEGLKLGSSLPPTELQPADDLALLAGNVFVSLWKTSNDEKYLYNAVALLEYALTRSKQSFHTRLMLIRIYRLLGVPSLALEHYRAIQVKQVEHDTLSHFILSRASTFSLAATGDLTLATECIESSQIYISNTQETGEFIARAFTAEKYTQIPEFIIFEDRLENSLQRDMVKIEHLRMRLTHEPISSDIIDMELIELKFIYDRAHHDNRDFDILADFQPASSEKLNEQTLLFGKREGGGWLASFLKLYIRAFQQGSDLDDTVEEKLLIGDRPKHTTTQSKKTLKDRLRQRKDEELAELTPDELAFYDYAAALADWLEPYHDYARPPPSVVLAEAAKLAEQKTGQPLKGVEAPPKNGNGTAIVAVKKDEEPPSITDAPELVVRFFDNMKTRFEAVKTTSSLASTLHVASLIQEAFLLFIVETLRFKTPSVVKVHKLGPLAQQFKPIRTNAVAVLRDISASLIKQSEEEATAEKRKFFVDACSLVVDRNIDHDFVLGVAKKVTDSRNKITEGVGKGIARPVDKLEHIPLNTRFRSVQATDITYGHITCRICHISRFSLKLSPSSSSRLENEPIPSGGGGFMRDSPSGSQGSPSSAVRLFLFSPRHLSPLEQKNLSAQSLRPVTLAQIRKATQMHTEADWMFDGQVLGQITVVAELFNHLAYTTNRTFGLDDGTARMDGKMWMDTAEDLLEQTWRGLPVSDRRTRQLKEPVYVRVTGTIKMHNNKRHIAVSNIRLVKDSNEVYFHILEVISMAVIAQKGLPSQPHSEHQQQQQQQQPGAANSQSAYSIQSRSNQAQKYFSALADEVMHYLQTTPSSDEGMFVGDIAKALNCNAIELSNTVDKLIDDGHVYTTVDDSHIQIAT